MNIVHVVPQIRREASGPTYVVSCLCSGLAARGAQVTIMCVAAGNEVPGVHVDVYRPWPVARRFEISTALARSLAHLSEAVDVVHNHSLWSMVNVASGIVVPQRRAKLVTAPHGTLAPWALAHSRLKKRLIWPLQKRALTRADLLHATCVEEYQEIRALGLRAPVAIIENGVDLPKLEERLPKAGARTLLFLSRLHPKKGLENLIDSWRRLEPDHPDWRLLIVGPGSPAYVASLESRIARSGVSRIGLAGPVFGDAKARAYRQADLFVLPTHSENFGMVVAEALAHECPAVVGRGAPWRGLEVEGCGWWRPNDVDSLTATLHAAMSQEPSVLHEMGRRGRAWMARDFAWDIIARRMELAYRWLLDGGEPPDWVHES